MSALADALARRVVIRVGTAAGAQTDLAVGAAAVTLAVTWARVESDATYGVTVTPSWLTTTAVTAKTTTGCTLAFGTAPGGAGGTVSVLTFRSED